MKMKPAQLILQNGVSFEGQAPEWQKGIRYGEVVFTTGMTGYIESLTDPSYSSQILVFTYPLIGNYGVLDHSMWESQKIQVEGVVVSEDCLAYSHPHALSSLLEWLKAAGIPLISGVDTRSLTKLLRTKGTLLGAIADLQTKPQFKKVDLSMPVLKVSPVEKTIYNPTGKKKVIAIDCGVKENSIRLLVELGLQVHRVPYDYDYTKEEYDGVFISNGPGDPTECAKTIEILKKALKSKKPIFGICLGNQLLALAAGATTYKLPFGHRSHNQPVMDLVTKKCTITSQNHGYAVDASTLPSNWRVRYQNLNDKSVEGIEHTKLPFFAVQFHPEAAPGPTDNRDLFQRFYESVIQ